jgi:hypothetical protein
MTIPDYSALATFTPRLEGPDELHWHSMLQHRLPDGLHHCAQCLGVWPCEGSKVYGVREPQPSRGQPFLEEMESALCPTPPETAGTA